MGRAITYLMAASVGLVIAMALALPSLLSVSPPPPPAEGAPAAMEGKVVTLADGMMKAPAPADNQTLLALDIPAGMLTATVNGQTLGELQSTMQVDISRYVRPGENTLRFFWVGGATASVTVTHAARAGAAREVTRAFISPSETAAPGERTVTFFL